MSDLLADTHAVVWYLFEPSQLSAAAAAALASAVKSGEFICVSVISVIEVRYLVEKHKLPATACADLVAALRDQSVPLKVLSVDLDVADALGRIPRAIVPDLPDRIIAATALAYGLPLVTCDAKIQAAPVTTIW